jgi:hypothetical protein
MTQRPEQTNVTTTAARVTPATAHGTECMDLRESAAKFFVACESEKSIR